MLLFSTLDIFHISVLLKNKEKHINILERKIIRTECILSIQKSCDFMNLLQNVLECSIENSRIVN